jgi:hypothetical protein
MASDGFDREAPRVAFLLASDLRDLDADPVLEPADYWERGRL